MPKEKIYKTYHRVLRRSVIAQKQSSPSVPNPLHQGHDLTNGFVNIIIPQTTPLNKPINNCE